MTNRYNNTHVTAAQRATCSELVAQTAKLVNTIGQAVAAGIPQEDCYAVIQHLAGYCQQPLPPDIHPAMTAAVTRVRLAMDALRRHAEALDPSSSPGPGPA
jgi:hypothetical protein